VKHSLLLDGEDEDEIEANRSIRHQFANSQDR
jgi:hypothetical protein